MRAEPEIFRKFRDCRRPDRTSANPHLVAGKQASRQAGRDGTSRRGAGRGSAGQRRAGRRESREGVKLEWARISI